MCCTILMLIFYLSKKGTSFHLLSFFETCCICTNKSKTFLASTINFSPHSLHYFLNLYSCSISICTRFACPTWLNSCNKRNCPSIWKIQPFLLLTEVSRTTRESVDLQMVMKFFNRNLHTV